MKVSDAMSRDVQLARPDQSICDAAKMMAAIDAGALPVQENDRLVGIITDRDIAVRAVAQHKGPDTPIREVMTADIKYCFEDEDLEHVAENMADLQVRRLPVLNREKRLVGIISVGDIATGDKPVRAGAALHGIAERSGQHNQSTAYAGKKPER